MRGLVALGIVVVVTAASLYWADCFQNQYLLYFIQVVSGNWSSSQPDKFNPYVFVIGALVAIILNLLTVAGILKAAIELTLIRKNKMNIRNAFNVRDQLAFKEILNTLTPITEKMSEEEAQKFEETLWNCFIDADRKWEENISTLMPGRAGKEFIERVSAGPA